MTDHKITVMNQLFKEWPRGTVALQSWLSTHGVSQSLATKYVMAHWLERIGKSAFIISGDEVDWTGGLYAIQQHAGLQVHVGAKTALEMQGHAHFIPMQGARVVWLFKPSAEVRNLPQWLYDNFASQVKIAFRKRKLFTDNNLGLTEKKFATYSIKISSRERAMMEYLDLAPDLEGYSQAIYLMEGLKTLRPDLVTVLLENCNSIKVKRLFMYLAEEENHPWLTRVDLSKADFGKGKRVIGKGGKYNAKYNLLVPIVSEE
ncbi:MAG: type IV toxin-antitoxin system AbiEi family antitoxin [Gammaproteobacteria bacterium]|nr:type IV toxin-antitoxin system AbiEi family antitoxin [Gammaproteobacteria bacterium]